MLMVRSIFHHKMICSFLVSYNSHTSQFPRLSDGLRISRVESKGRNEYKKCSKSIETEGEFIKTEMNNE